jgi:hypothetical protein
MLPRGWPADWGGASKRRWNAKRLTTLKKQYSEQKNIDAVCLAANGGGVDLLSGESGRLKVAVQAMQRHQEFEYRRADMLSDICQRVREMLPPLPDREAKDVF